MGHIFGDRLVRAGGRYQPVLDSQSCQDLVDGLGSALVTGLGQMGVDSGSGRGGVSQVALDEAQVETRFQQMGGIRMSESMNGCIFVNAAFSHGCTKSSL